MSRKLKDTKAPKRPLTSFLLFSNHIRDSEPKIKKLPIQEQAAKIGEKWREAPEELKKQFEEEALRNKKIYLEQKKEYEQTDDYKEFQKKLKEEKKDSKEPKKKRNVKLSGYRLFISELNDAENDENDEELAGKSYMAKSAIKWSRLTDEEKEEYNKKAAKISEDTNNAVPAKE